MLREQYGVTRSQDDAVRRDVIQRLMCNFFIDIPSVERRWGIEFRSYFASDLARLARYQDEGLVLAAGNSIRATSVGELFVRNLAMCFDRYLHDKHEGGGTNLFSRTV